MYQLTKYNAVTRLSDGAFIPLADGNADYEAYKKWLADGNTPLPVPQPSLDQVKADKLNEISQACTARMGAVKAGYPQDEISTWDKQESEARAYVANNAAATPLLSALAAARGVDLADLAGRVIAKADAFATISGALIGKRQRYEDMISAATDAETVASVSWQD